jgi:hypothetical protein
MTRISLLIASALILVGGASGAAWAQSSSSGSTDSSTTNSSGTDTMSTTGTGTLAPSAMPSSSGTDTGVSSDTGSDGLGNGITSTPSGIHINTIMGEGGAIPYYGGEPEY